MNRHIFSSIAVLAIAGGTVWASAKLADKKSDSNEKQRPSAEVMAKKVVSRAHYARMKAEGNENGAPYGLTLRSVSDKEVSLTWISPEKVDGYFDDFENHTDFEINSTGNIGWSYIDGDNANTYTWQACKFTNQGQKMAFIVMNPWKTSPAVNENPNYQPYSGQKMLVDFCAVDAQNNDYIISPELNFNSDFQFSFMARSYKVGTNFAKERIRVGYSTTGKRPSDFIFVNEDPYLELPDAWTLVKYNIPKEAKYVTVNCVSDDGFMLMIDDIFVGTNKVRPGSTAKAAAANPVVGFNIYRNGEKVNSTPVDSVRYTDNVPEYGDMTYTVTAVYQNGEESAQSEPLKVNVPDTRLLPFEDSFDDWTLNEDKWSTTQDDGTTESYWSVDYYEYGLVDPSATYKWSALTNYDQSLMTRELHTTDRSNTYLRFNLKLRNSEQTNVDYLSVEVSSDGGNSWKEVKTYDNKNGGFEWTVCQFNLAEYLTNNLFKVRFRAHGKDAKWINYWYVDDIKIWNPVWTNAKLEVKAKSGNISNCTVEMTGDNGAEINTTTDNNGMVEFSQIEEGKYDVVIMKDGYNIYNGEWNIKNGNSNSLSATLTQPEISLSENSINADIDAEGSAIKTFTMTNNGDGPLTWKLNSTPAKASGDDTNRWKTMPSFNTSGDLQQSIAFDGKYYYTTSSVELGKFWKYDSNGKFIEQFSIPKMYYMLYDITYDGRYFYGSDHKNRLFKLDFDNRRLVGIIDIASEPSLEITHCSYDPDRKGFWIGGFSTIGFVNMKGEVKTRFTSLSTSSSMAVYGSAYDNVSPGGPYLWLSDMTAESDDKIDKIMIRQFDLNKRVITNVKHVLNDAPGYVIGNQTSGENYVCGLFSTTDITPGQLTLVGILNQSPNLVFRYTLCEADKWLDVSPKHGTLAAGEKQVFNVNFNGLEMKKGDKAETAATVIANPELENKNLSFNLNAINESPAPRPQGVTATPGKASVTLKWNKGNGSALAESYNVYRNNVKVNKEPVKEMTYTDSKLVYGNYTYKVTAVYGGSKESAKSDSVNAFVNEGAQYYAPLRLSSSIDHNKNVALSWESPLADRGHRDTLTWANGNHADELGLASTGFFYAGCKWEAQDIVKYRNKKISSVAIQLVNNCTYLALRISKDDEVIYKKQFKGNILYDGSFTNVPVEDDIVLEPGHSYLFAFQIMNEADINPLSIDDSKAVNGKGNLLSLDGTNWFTAAESGIDGNINLRVNVAPQSEESEMEPVGYNIYRNGEKVNYTVVTGNTFNETLPTTGVHSYTATSVYADGGESSMSNPASVEAYQIDNKVAPKNIAAVVQRNRNVSLRWDLPVENLTFAADLAKRPVTTSTECPEYVNTFLGEKSAMAVASDGKYIYTSVYNESGRIERYTLDGKSAGSFVVSDVDGIRNLAFDGKYLYAADNTTNIHKIDPETMSLIETIAISEYSRHLAYIPTLDNGNGGFEVGDWETSIMISKNGSKLATGPAFKGAAGTAYYDGKIYAFEQGNDANAYTIGIYDAKTSKRIGDLDMGKYLEIDDISAATAGGMSTFSDANGETYLLLSLQRRGEQTQFVILDMGGQKTVAGYNIYRNGEKVNAEPVERRYFEETISQEGEYKYNVQTVYIDNSTSELSTVANATIVAQGEAKVPENVKAEASTYGYNVLLSFADPDMNNEAATINRFDNLDNGTTVFAVEGENYKSNITVNSDHSFSGTKSAAAAKGSEAFGVMKAEGMGYLRMALRNADDHKGNGTVTVYYSTGGTQRSNFIQLTSYPTTEAWQDILCPLPANTEYVAIAKSADMQTQYLDDIALYKNAPESNTEGFDIYRNGEKLNTVPVSGISYVDHNLLPGHYDYQVKLITKTAAESELSDVASIDLNYDNGGLAPTNLKAEKQADSSNKLSWQFPALGEPVYLRWHDGNSYDAAGLPNGGAFFAGANWFASDLKNYGNMSLSDVEVYINQIPEALFLLVYENNTLVRQQFVQNLKQYSFNTIHLDEPLKINTEKNLRVAVYVEHNEITVPLGYDRGPANSGRGDLYSTDGTTWSTMEDAGTDIDANWCISIGLSAYSNELPGMNKVATKKAPRFAPRKTADMNTPWKTAHVTNKTASEKNVFEGYNVYRNGDRQNDETMFDTTFVDTKSYNDKYLEYQVSAVYSVSGEKFSDKVTLVTSSIDGTASSNGIRIEAKNALLNVYGATAGSLIKLYSANGSLVSSTPVTDSYKQSVTLLGKPSGTYIVKIGKSTFKLIIK